MNLIENTVAEQSKIRQFTHCDLIFCMFPGGAVTIKNKYQRSALEYNYYFPDRLPTTTFVVVVV